MAISKTLWNVPVCQLPVLMGSFWPEIFPSGLRSFLLTWDLWALCAASPHGTEVAVLMHHNLQTSRAHGKMFLPLGKRGDKCPSCPREMCPLNRCFIVFMCFCWSTEVRECQADASFQRVVYEGLPQAGKMNPLNSSTAQANGAGAPKVTYLTNPARGVAIPICQEVRCERCRETDSP